MVGGIRLFWSSLLVLVLLVGGGWMIHSDQERFAIDPNLRAITDWLANNRNDRPVIVGTRDQGAILIYGQIPPSARRLAQTRDESGELDKDQLQNLFQGPGQKLLIYDNLPDGLDFHPVLHLRLEENQERFGCLIKPMFSSGSYAVFLVEPKQNLTEPL